MKLWAEVTCGTEHDRNHQYKAWSRSASARPRRADDGSAPPVKSASVTWWC